MKCNIDLCGWLLLNPVGKSNASSFHYLFVNRMDLVAKFSSVGNAKYLRSWVFPVNSQSWANGETTCLSTSISSLGNHVFDWFSHDVWDCDSLYVGWLLKTKNFGDVLQDIFGNSEVAFILPSSGLANEGRSCVLRILVFSDDDLFFGGFLVSFI